jgi:hypothetical protein
MEPIDCPKCGLTNPWSAERCDCGYDFARHQLRESLLSPEEQRHNLRHRSSVELFACFMFPLFGILTGLVWLVIARLRIIFPGLGGLPFERSWWLTPLALGTCALLFQVALTLVLRGMGHASY